MTNKIFVVPPVLQRYTMPSIFEALQAQGRSWNVFFHDIPQSFALTHLRKRPHRSHFGRMKTFYNAASAETLAEYTFIEPQYFNYGPWRANDQHGGHSVSLGDTLVAHVYEALRANADTWPHTMLLIVHDEHGGFFDHVPPSYDGMPTGSGSAVVRNPDGKHSHSPRFSFERLGARVPAIVVSPFVPRGTQSHDVYEHASIPATARAVAGIGMPLNVRDATAHPFHHLASLDQMRTDTPTTLPRADDIDRAREFELRMYNLVDTPETLTAALDTADGPPLNDLQATLYEFAGGLTESGAAEPLLEPAAVVNEQRAAARVRRNVDRFLAADL